jgi:HK97 family phage prohead protease
MTSLTTATIALKAATSAGFAGYASTWGNRDRQDEIVHRGAFGGPDELERFLRTAPILWNHRDDRPIAYPVLLREDDVGLWLTARWHTTALADEARQILTERREAGKAPFGLSIGFRPIDRRLGRDGIVHLYKAELLEISLVSIPANPLAEVVELRSAGGTDDLAAIAAHNEAELARLRFRRDEGLRRIEADNLAALSRLRVAEAVRARRILVDDPIRRNAELAQREIERLQGRPPAPGELEAIERTNRGELARLLGTG